MLKAYKLPCLLWAVVLMAAVVSKITGEALTAVVWYGFVATLETYRRTKILLRRYRRAMEEKQNERESKKAVRISV